MTDIAFTRADPVLTSAYDAALDPALWGQVLAELARLFRCHFVDLFARDADFSTYGGLCHGLDVEDYRDELLDTWVKRNAWGQKQPTKYPGEVISTRQILPPEELRRHAMYHEYLAPRGLHEGMRLTLAARHGWVQDMSLLRSWNDGPFTQDELALASALLPHLQRACALSRRLEDAGLGLPVELERLDAAAQAALILDDQGRVHHFNEAAGRIFKERGTLTVHRSRLCFDDDEAGRFVEAFVERARRPGSVAVPATLTTSRPIGRGLRITLVWLGRPPAWLAMRGAATLVLIDRPGEANEDAAVRIAKRFDLTQAEAELARRLAAGASLREIATGNGRSINTVRTHLARIMAKTGTRRQGELISLLLATEGSLRQRPPQPCA